MSGDATMQKVLETFGAKYLAKFRGRMPWVQVAAMHDLAECRTPAKGGHVVGCEDCRTRDYAYHSCNNRHCPKCSFTKGLEWLAARTSELLPVPYFQVVFTVPDELRRVIRSHPRKLYTVMMKAAAESLQELGRDERFIGGQLSVMTVLHTWSRTLEYNPHVHNLVAAGGVDENDNWLTPKTGPNWLMPSKALGLLFYAKFVAGAREAVPGIQLPGSIHKKKPWLVHVERAKLGAGHVTEYLARYMSRVALSDSRILEVTSTTVTFKYRSKDRKSWRTMTLKGEEFLRRFLQHILPPRFNKVRYHGLWSGANRKRLLKVKQKLESQSSTPPATVSPKVAEQLAKKHDWLKCPNCGRYRTILGEFKACEKPPPLERYPFRTPPPASTARSARSP